MNRREQITLPNGRMVWRPKAIVRDLRAERRRRDHLDHARRRQLRSFAYGCAVGAIALWFTVEIVMPFFDGQVKHAIGGW